MLHSVFAYKHIIPTNINTLSHIYIMPPALDKTLQELLPLMTKYKVLVIGSNSFSGSHFVAEALAAGHPVWGVSRSPEPDPVFLPYRWHQSNGSGALATAENFSFQAIDLNNQLNTLLELIDRIQPELVVNFAAQGMVAESWLNPNHWYRTNVLAQVALHDELRRKPFLKKYVHVTTPEVYGSTDGGWIKEHNHFAPSTPMP